MEAVNKYPPTSIQMPAFPVHYTPPDGLPLDGKSIPQLRFGDDDPVFL
jgi:hypothetical protein